MTPEEIKQSIAGWSSEGGGDLEYTGDRSEAGHDFAFGVRAAGSGGAPVDLQVLQPSGLDRILIRHTASASGKSAAAARSLVDERPGWITGTVDSEDRGTSVNLETAVYHDGFSKHTFMQAVAEIARSARLVGGLSTAAAATGAAAAEEEKGAGAGGPLAGQPLSPMPSPTPAMPAPSFSSQPQQQPGYQPQPSYQPQSYQPQPSYQPQQPSYQPQGPGGAWAPTHTVPPQGLRAWAAPDPAGPVVATLAPGLPIQVAEVRGAWARVICSNGWTGWIDGRIIGVAA